MTGTRLGQVPIVASWMHYGVDLQRNRNAHAHAIAGRRERAISCRLLRRSRS